MSFSVFVFIFFSPLFNQVKPCLDKTLYVTDENGKQQITKPRLKYKG